MTRERLHQVEDSRRLALVAGQSGALGESVGDDDEPLRREVSQIDRTARRNLVILVGGDLDDGRLLVVPHELAADPLAQRPDHIVLLQRRQADQDDDAVAEQSDESLLSSPEGERTRGQKIAALEPCDVESVADQKGAGSQARTRTGRAFYGLGLVHFVMHDGEWRPSLAALARLWQLDPL